MTQSDGRLQRSERSRQQIADAIIELVEEGILIPTAQQVAARANVGIRTVFRHFSEMNELYLLADEQVKAGYNRMFAGGDRSGELEERVDKLIAHLGSAFERTRNLHLSTHAQLWRIDAMRDNYIHNTMRLRRNILSWLPELDDRPQATQDAAYAILSFETWHRLRGIQGLSFKRTQAAIAAMLHALLLRSE